MTVFYIGLFLWFQPFYWVLNIWKHLLVCVLKSVAVVSCLSWWITAPCRLKLITVVTATCFSSFLFSRLLLRSDWTLMKDFVLPHCVFTCHSIRRRTLKKTDPIQLETSGEGGFLNLFYLCAAPSSGLSYIKTTTFGIGEMTLKLPGNVLKSFFFFSFCVCVTILSWSAIFVFF